MQQSKFLQDYKECIYNSNYLIYNDGRVYSKYINKIMSTHISSGYYAVCISIGNGSKTFRIHRLVALHFVKNEDPLNFNIVNHINGNKLDNNYTNLEWTDQKGNCEHALENGFSTPGKQQRPVVQFDINGDYITEFQSIAEATRQTKINDSAIRRSCKLEKIVTTDPDGNEFIWQFKSEKIRIPCPEGGKQHEDWVGYVIFPNGSIFSKHLSNFMSTSINEDGYEVISFKQLKVQKKFTVHHLVATNFLVKPEGENLQIGHKNNIRHCNNVENLEFVTPSENNKYIWTNGGKMLDQRKVLRIHSQTKEITVFANANTASKELNIPYPTIMKAIHKDNAISLTGYIWQYESDTIKEPMKEFKPRKAIERIHPITREITEFKDASSAAKNIDDTRKHIYQACDSGKLLKNFLWKYKGEDLKIYKDKARNVVRLTASGKIIKIYKTAKAAAADMEGGIATIRSHCSTGALYKGSIWKFSDEM